MPRKGIKKPDDFYPHESTTICEAQRAKWLSPGVRRAAHSAPINAVSGANAPLLTPANKPVLKSLSTTDHIISTDKCFMLFS